MKKLFHLFCCMGLCASSNAQVLIDTRPLNTGHLEAVVYGKEFLNDRIPYNRIKGSPYWNDNWRTAQLFDTKNRLLETLPTRINLASGELHLLRNNQEFVPTSAVVQRVLFAANDSEPAVEFILLPQPLPVGVKTNAAFVQVLTQEGGHQLLKAVERRLNSADSLFGTQKRYFFADKEDYFLVYNNKMAHLKRLTKDYLLPYFPQRKALEDWMQTGKRSFRNEQDVVAALNWYNKQYGRPATASQ